MQRELLMEHVIELESSSITVHKAMIGEKRALMVQEQGLVAKYNTDMSTRPKTVFCHAYNNYGYCKFYKACCYKHEDAPTCKFDMLCTRTKCGYYHTPKPSPGLLSLKEQVISWVGGLLAFQFEPSMNILYDLLNNFSSPFLKAAYKNTICQKGFTQISKYYRCS